MHGIHNISQHGGEPPRPVRRQIFGHSYREDRRKHWQQGTRLINERIYQCSVLAVLEKMEWGGGLHALGGVCKADGMLGSPLSKLSIRFTRPEKLV